MDNQPTEPNQMPTPPVPAEQQPQTFVQQPATTPLPPTQEVPPQPAQPNPLPTPPTPNKKSRTPLIVAIIVIVIIIIVVLLFALHNHNSSNSTYTKATQSAEQSIEANTSKLAGTTTVGKSIVIKDAFQGTQATVTVESVNQAAQPINASYIVPAGMHDVSVTYSIVNSGNKKFSDDADTASEITTSTGAQSGFVTDQVNGCTQITGYTLTPGQSTEGCVTYQIADGSTVAQAKYTQQIGDWGIWKVQ